MLRTVRQVPHGVYVYGVSHGFLQRAYHFEHDDMAELSVRRSIGLPWSGSVHELVWIQAENEQGQPLWLGVEPAYAYERTGMLISPNIASHADTQTVPVQAILEAVLVQLEPVLGFQAQGLTHSDSLPQPWKEAPIRDYMALDHRQHSKLLILGQTPALDWMEQHTRNYCAHYWACHEQMGRQIRLAMSLGIYPAKRKWTMVELAELEQGDLLTLQQRHPTQEAAAALRGYLRLNNATGQQQTYEVLIHMNNDDTTLQFGMDTPTALNEALPVDVPPHELIELEIHAGQTRIPFGELCAVQAGTLIELSHHNLPMVTLCVNGAQILEGELVVFKDQVMVQVTKRLE